MPALQVRDFPQDLYNRLRTRAQQESRSITQETIALLRAQLLEDDALLPHPEGAHARTSETNFIEKRRALFKQIEALGDFDVPEGFPTPEEMVRQDRNSR